ncbi:MAG: 3-deoxy-manno-octulosonate cytidylyltransferase, partial [Flavobacteriaceae bacterium]|nr:3-deoxy-manno-octulosonate cytidylyltransferase [Flavobacteriaceae bacterium]
VMPVKNDKDLMSGGVFVVIDRFKNALYFSRAVIPFIRDIPKKDWYTKHLFYKHVGMYGFKPKALKEFASLQQTSLELAESLEQNRWLENGKKIKVEITELETYAVDTNDDLEIVRKIIKKQA